MTQSDGSNSPQMDQLASALESLYEVYTPEGVGIWLKGRNRRFDGRRPIDLIRDGDVYEFAAEVVRLAGPMVAS